MNNANICSVIYSNRSDSKNEINNSIEFYKNETKEHVKHYLPAMLGRNTKKVKGLVYYILTNEDLFSNIMTAIMLADHTHDPKRGSIKYWRNKNCLWTIDKTIKQNKHRLSEIPEYKYTKSPLEELIAKESTERIEAKLDGLETQKKEIYDLYHNENLTEKEIAKIQNISQQKVSTIIVEIKRWMTEAIKVV